jgi:hypothetical protein
MPMQARWLTKRAIIDNLVDFDAGCLNLFADVAACRRKMGVARTFPQISRIKSWPDNEPQTAHEDALTDAPTLDQALEGLRIVTLSSVAAGFPRLNRRQTAFARAIAAGSPRREAQVAAGYRPNRKNARALMASPRARVASLARWPGNLVSPERPRVAESRRPQQGARGRASTRTQRRCRVWSLSAGKWINEAN